MPAPRLIAEISPQFWKTVTLSEVTRHVLESRRETLVQGLAAVDASIGDCGTVLAVEWRSLSRFLRQHLAREQAWLDAENHSRHHVDAAQDEHERLHERLEAFRTAISTESGAAAEALRAAVDALSEMVEEQVCREQTLLFPRLRACRETGEHAMSN